MSTDQAVSVGWVSNNNYLNISTGVIVDSLSSLNKNLSIFIKEVSTLLAISLWFGTNKKCIVSIFVGN